MITELLGKVIISILPAIFKGEVQSLTFVCSTGEQYLMYHDPDCCEHVWLQDTDGDLKDLLLYPITLAEESTNKEQTIDTRECESFTWTFYRFATIKGYVTLRWLGESNGYYSEEMTFKKIN